MSHGEEAEMSHGEEAEMSQGYFAQNDLHIGHC